MGWVKLITYHKCTRYFRKSKDVLVTETDDGFMVFDTLEEENADFIPAEALDKEDFRKTIMSMIDSVSDEQRMAVMMYYFDELSIKRIAEIQEVSEGTVKSRLNYARKAVKSSVEEYENRYQIKLHSFGIAPFMLWLFGADKACVLSPTTVTVVANGVSSATGVGVSVVTSVTPAASAAVGGNVAVAVGAASAKAVGGALTAKIVAGVVAAAIAITGGTLTIHHFSEDSDRDKNDDEEVVSSIEDYEESDETITTDIDDNDDAFADDESDVPETDDVPEEPEEEPEEEPIVERSLFESDYLAYPNKTEYQSRQEILLSDSVDNGDFIPLTQGYGMRDENGDIYFISEGMRSETVYKKPDEILGEPIAFSNGTLYTLDDGILYYHSFDENGNVERANVALKVEDLSTDIVYDRFNEVKIFGQLAPDRMGHFFPDIYVVAEGRELYGMLYFSMFDRIITVYDAGENVENRFFFKPH